MWVRVLRYKFIYTVSYALSISVIAYVPRLFWFVAIQARFLHPLFFKPVFERFFVFSYFFENFHTSLLTTRRLLIGRPEFIRGYAFNFIQTETYKLVVTLNERQGLCRIFKIQLAIISRWVAIEFSKYFFYKILRRGTYSISIFNVQKLGLLLRIWSFI